MRATATRCAATPALVARDVRDGLVSEPMALALYGVSVLEGEPDETATELERDRLRAVRLAEARSPADEPGAGLDGAIAVHPVCDTVEAVELDGRRRLRCRLCHHDLGAYEANPKRAAKMRELPLAAINPHNHCACETYVLREYYCPGCATSIAADVAERDEPILDELSLRAWPEVAGTAPSQTGEGVR